MVVVLVLVAEPVDTTEVEDNLLLLLLLVRGDTEVGDEDEIIAEFAIVVGVDDDTDDKGEQDFVALILLIMLLVLTLLRQLLSAELLKIREVTGVLEAVSTL